MQVTKRGKLKPLMLSLCLAAFMLPATNATAQYGGENDFFALDETVLEEYFAVDNTYGMSDYGSVLDGISNLMEAMEYNRSGGIGLGDAVEENPLPLGSGIVILVGAGLGYAAIKRKEETK